MKTKTKAKRAARRKPVDVEVMPLISHLTHWKTKEGKIVLIHDMTFEHLLNARVLLRRRIARMSAVDDVMSAELLRRSGAAIQNWGYGVDPEPAVDPDGGQK